MGRPVKVILERRVTTGQEAAFRAWAESFVRLAAAAPGHEGASVLSSGSGGSQVILLRFASAAEFERWRESPEYRQALRLADQSSLAGEDPQVRSGLETWFTLPGNPAHVLPRRWKMALVTWLALLPQVIVLSVGLEPLRLPFLINVAVSTAVPVAMLTWVVMPWLTRRLQGWLHGR